MTVTKSESRTRGKGEALSAEAFCKTQQHPCRDVRHAPYQHCLPGDTIDGSKASGTTSDDHLQKIK